MNKVWYGVKQFLIIYLKKVYYNLYCEIMVKLYGYCTFIDKLWSACYSQCITKTLSQKKDKLKTILYLLLSRN